MTALDPQLRIEEALLCQFVKTAQCLPDYSGGIRGRDEGLYVHVASVFVISDFDFPEALATHIIRIFVTRLEEALKSGTRLPLLEARRSWQDSLWGVSTIRVLGIQDGFARHHCSRDPGGR